MGPVVMTIKAKYTQGDNSQEFEFNSMDELLEYERSDKGVVIDCDDMKHEQEKEAIKQFNKPIDWSGEIAIARRKHRAIEALQRELDKHNAKIINGK